MTAMQSSARNSGAVSTSFSLRAALAAPRRASCKRYVTAAAAAAAAYPVAAQLSADLVDMRTTVPSLEPAAPAVLPEEHAAGTITTVRGSDEFQRFLRVHASQVVVLMCKAKSCRPCKMFTRKYARVAEQYPQVVFLDIFGDESRDTRKMMVEMGIKATPTFRLYLAGELVRTHSGVSEKNLTQAVEEAMLLAPATH